MKAIHLFKTGTHTSAAGQTITFSESDVRAMVDAYNPAVHQAPLVVGHPKDNDPAYGWVSGLSYAEGDVEALPDQVDTDFAELVEQGRFKYVSASLYSPDSPSNPTPGRYYLRHVGFLGAQPPAIKGLRPVQFDEGEEGIVEFAVPARAATIAVVFRALRDFMIDKFNRDEADRVVPDWIVSDLEEDARRPPPEPAAVGSDFEEVDDMDKAELERREAEAAAKLAQFNEREASIAERELRLAQTEQAQRAEANRAFADGLVRGGKLLPKDVPSVLGFMEALDAAEPISFAEGEAAQAPGERFRTFMQALPVAVDFTERAPAAGTGTEELTGVEKIKRAAQDFMDAERKAGRTVTLVQAMAHVRTQEATA